MLTRQDLQRRVALVVPGLQYGGGVPTVALFLYRLLESTGRYEPSLVSLSTASDDALGVLLLDPSTWRRGGRTAVGTWRGLPVTYVGALFAEFEFQRFRPRRVLTELLENFDLIQVVSGTPAMGMTVAEVQKPSCLFVATTIRRERVSLLADISGLRGLWLRLMTAINAWSEPRALAVRGSCVCAKRVHAVSVVNDGPRGPSYPWAGLASIRISSIRQKRLPAMAASSRWVVLVIRARMCACCWMPTAGYARACQTHPGCCSWESIRVLETGQRP